MELNLLKCLLVAFAVPRPARSLALATTAVRFNADMLRAKVHDR